MQRFLWKTWTETETETETTDLAGSIDCWVIKYIACPDKSLPWAHLTPPLPMKLLKNSIWKSFRRNGNGWDGVGDTPTILWKLNLPSGRFYADWVVGWRRFTVRRDSDVQPHPIKRSCITTMDTKPLVGLFPSSTFYFFFVDVCVPMMNWVFVKSRVSEFFATVNTSEG